MYGAESSLYWEFTWCCIEKQEIKKNINSLYRLGIKQRWKLRSTTIIFYLSYLHYFLSDDLAFTWAFIEVQRKLVTIPWERSSIQHKVKISLGHQWGGSRLSGFLLSLWMVAQKIKIYHCGLYQKDDAERAICHMDLK